MTVMTKTKLLLQLRWVEDKMLQNMKISLQIFSCI